MRTSSSSLSLDSLSTLATRRTFAGGSTSSSTSRDRFITGRCGVDGFSESCLGVKWVCYLIATTSVTARFVTIR